MGHQHCLALVLEGTFELAAYAEAIGQGLEQRIGFLSVPVVIGQQIYPPVDMVVAAGTLPDQTARKARRFRRLQAHHRADAPQHRGGTVGDVVAVEEGTLRADASNVSRRGPRRIHQEVVRPATAALVFSSVRARRPK